MSASKNKIIRRQLAEAGKDKRTLAAEKEAAERRKTRIQYSIIGVVVVLLFAFIFIYNSAWPSRHMTAVTINGEDYTVAQMNFYYSSAYSSYYSNNYIDVLMGNAFDTSADLDEQEYSEGYSWHDYFIDEAIDDMTEIQILNEMAEADGFELSDEDTDEYEEELEEIQTYWSENGYSSLQQFLNLNYGKGVNMALLEQEMYRVTLADAYADSLVDAYEYTDSELDEYYGEHADEYDMITYAYYIVSDDSVDADAIAGDIEGFTEEEFSDYLNDNYDGASATSLTYAGNQLSDSFSEWLLDAGREPGDSTVIIEDADTDYASTYVLLFVERNTNDYDLVSFRHILINAVDEDGDGEYSEEDLEQAVTQAEDIYDEWQSGDATEDSFAELANTYSEDTGSNTTGGLYEDVYQGQMVDSINDWIFDAAREAGDTTIVTNEGSSYTGAHLVYFVGVSDETYAQSIARSYLSGDDYDAWIEGIKADYTAVTSHLGMCGQNR